MEDYGESKTVTKLTDMIGRGQVSVSSAVELAQCVTVDQTLPHEAIRAFSTLGSDGKHPQNAERDLHRWLRSLFGFELQSYTIKLHLQASLLGQKVLETFCQKDFSRRATSGTSFFFEHVASYTFLPSSDCLLRLVAPQGKMFQ